MGTLPYFQHFYIGKQFSGGGGGGGGGVPFASPEAKDIPNKSTASGAIYARSLVIFHNRMAFVRGRLMQ